MSICPECHQPIHHERFGVQMTPLKATILDRIRASGRGGADRLGRASQFPAAAGIRAGRFRQNTDRGNIVMSENYLPAITPALSKT
jgi:hypothetical protein